MKNEPSGITGCVVGGTVGSVISGALWVVFGVALLVFGAGLLGCVGIANGMSVNNSSWRQLVLDFPGIFWEVFGDFVVTVTPVLCVVTPVTILVAAGVGQVGGVLVGRLR